MRGLALARQPARATSRDNPDEDDHTTAGLHVALGLEAPLRPRVAQQGDELAHAAPAHVHLLALGIVRGHPRLELLVVELVEQPVEQRGLVLGTER